VALWCSALVLDVNRDLDALAYALGHDAEVLEGMKAACQRRMLGRELRVEGHVDLAYADFTRN